MAWAPDYASLVEARAYVTRSTSTVDDVELGLAVTAASRAVDRATNRQFGLVAAEERAYPVRWDRRACRYVVDIDDLMTTTGLVVAGVAFDSTVHRLVPINAAQRGRPWERLVLATLPEVSSDGEATVEAPWGWSAIPAPAKNATLLQTSRFAARRNSPFGIAGSPEQGSELRLLARVDPDVAVMLAPFVRWWAAA
jgi:hypothetical protein